MSQNESLNKDIIKKDPAAGDRETVKKSDPERKPAPRKEGDPERKPAPRKEGEPERKPAPRKEGDPERKPAPRKEGEPERKPVTRKEGDPERKPAPRKEGEPERKPVPRKEGEPERKPAPRKEGDPERKPAPRKEGDPERKPAPRKEGDPERRSVTRRDAAPAKRPESRNVSGPERRAARRNETLIEEDEMVLIDPVPGNNSEGNEGKKKKRRKKSKLLGAYFIYLAVLIIVSTIVLLVLWIKLADYQKGLDAKQEALAAAPTPTPMPKDETKEAQSAFEKYADALTASDWTSMWMDCRSDDPEDRETVEGYFTKALDENGTAYYLDLMYEEENPVYKIKIGDKDAARVFMGRDMTGHWSKTSVELVYQGDHEVQDELPSGMELLVNGSAVQPSEETADHFPYSSIKDILVNPVVWNVYDVKGMLSEPELGYGNEESFIWSEDDGCYLALAEGIPDEVTERAEKFFYAYMNYTMSGGAGWKDYKAAKEAAEASGQPAPGNPVLGRLGGCTQYIPSDSVAYSMLQKAFDSTCYGLAYTNHEYGLMETRGPIRWADNCIGVDFFYHAYATLNGQRKDYSGGDQVFRVFFVNFDGTWKIWAFSA